MNTFIDWSVPVDSAQLSVKIGDEVIIKPEFRAAGDKNYIWTAINTPDPVTGWFNARVSGNGGSPCVVELHVSYIA